ncbi:hypothetical protein ACIBG7_20145 [Nonomuraea sp. NPDC050328]|uniref:hypothetical protein n=1 Tax=Nonomuraea sp. NPDC050328 TaxID=3364361 RepID=UPI0037B3A941
MIIKVYHVNGTPDLTRWIVTCDNDCPSSTPLLEASSAGWLLAHRDTDLCYCPACIEMIAMCLISWALTCPGCGSPHLLLGTDSLGTAEVILCGGVCRSAYLAPDGWHCACCGDLITEPDGL